MEKGDKIRIGSLFAGIGGFELGIERAIPGAETIWQVEQNKYCQSILKKHWPDAKIYDDVRNITKHNVEPVDILIGGFPCQSISTAGKQEGLENEEKSGLWWEFHRIISELRPRIVVMENVANVLRLGGLDILGSLAEIGYDAEWTIISAKQFGAPHIRKRWFCVAYPNGERLQTNPSDPESTNRKTYELSKFSFRKDNNATNANGERLQTQFLPIRLKTKCKHTQGNSQDTCQTYWQKNPPESPLCSVDDGISARLARLKALGNAIVPQCSQYIGECIYRSGLLDDFFK